MELCRHEMPADRCGICNASNATAHQGKSAKSVTDVVIVAAGIGYPEYLQYGAYVGHPNRPFRDTSRWMAFYADGEIKPEVPEILEVESAVTFTYEEVKRREESTDATSQRIGGLIRALLDTGKRELGAELDVVLLSPVSDPGTVKLSQTIPSDKIDHAGRATAVTAGQYRYTTREKLEAGPSRTSELGL